MDIHLADMISMSGIYAILALGLNVVVGWAGVISVAQAAFCGVGAVTTAIVCTRFGISPWIAMGGGMMASAVLGVITAVPALRLQDDYLLLSTLGFGEIVYQLLRNLDSITGGPSGISGIPMLSAFGFSIKDSGLLPLVIWLFTGIVAGGLYAIEHSPFGRALFAVRDDEIAATSLGFHPAVYKLIAIVVGAAIASFAGSLLAHKLSFVSSETGFNTPYSVAILAMVILGGRGSILGAILGAIIVTTFPELLRRFGLPVEYAAPVRQMFFGSLLVAIVILRPKGLLGRLEFRQ